MLVQGWSKNARTSAVRFFRIHPRVATAVRQAGTAWVSLAIRDFVRVLPIVESDSR